jgi:tetratricopeptide (TPR) repeat protein
MKKIIIAGWLISLCMFLAAQTDEDLFLLGSAQFSKSLFDASATTFTRALENDPENPQLLLRRGEAYMYSGDYDAAIKDFSTSGQISHKQEFLWLAKCYALKGDTDYAIANLRSHLASSSRLPEDDIKTDPAFDALQLSNGWYDLWQEEWYTGEENDVRSALRLMNTDRLDEAMEVINTSIRGGNSTSQAFFARGSINFRKENYAVSVSDFTKAISENGDNADYFFSRGYANLKAGNKAAAVEDFTRSLQIRPGLFRALIGRAEANAAAGSYSAAIRDVETYLLYFENDQEAVFMCGNYLTETGNYLDALRCFNINLDKDKNNPVYYRQRGRTNLLAHTYRSAIYDLTMSLDLDPRDGKTWLYLGIALLDTGNREDACSCFNKAQGLGESEAIRYIVDNCR